MLCILGEFAQTLERITDKSQWLHPLYPFVYKRKLRGLAQTRHAAGALDVIVFCERFWPRRGAEVSLRRRTSASMQVGEHAVGNDHSAARPEL